MTARLLTRRAIASLGGLLPFMRAQAQTPITGPIDYRNLDHTFNVSSSGTVSVAQSGAISPGADLSQGVVTSTGSTAARSLADRFAVFNAKDFSGVTGNGVADDTAGLVAAFAAAAAAGAALYLTRSVYMISSALSWPAGLVGIFGDGLELTIIRRMAGGAGTNQMITVSGRTGFFIRDLQLDGNKANNTTASQGLVLTGGCSDFRIRRVRSINHKAVAGFGGGIVLSACPATNPNGLTQLIEDCETLGNDSDGVAIATSGASITINRGNHSSNGGGGVHVNGNLAATLNQIPDLSILGVRAEHNSGGGIVVNGFTVIGLGGVPTYGHGNDPCVGTVIQGCQANYNAGYGIFAQVTGGKVLGNTCRGNGGAGLANQAGICTNAERTIVSGNFCDGNIAFGIDAGGAFQCVVSNNTLSNSSSCELDAGGGQNSIFENNVLTAGASTASMINCNRNEAGGFYFSFDASNTTIRNNTLINTISNTIIGIQCIGNPEDTYIEGNRFVWPDTTGSNCIRPLIKRGTLKGNMLVGTTGGGFLMNVTANLAPPDWADVVYINTDTTPITNLTTNQFNAAGGTVTGVKMTNRGSGYTSAPTVTPTGTWSVAPTFTAHLTQDGRVAAITIATAGSGVANGATVAISGGGGSGATATLDVSGQNIMGREVTLIGFGSQFRVQGGGAAFHPLAAGAVITVPTFGSIKFISSQSQVGLSGWGITDVYPTTLTLNNGPTFNAGTGAATGTQPKGSVFLRTDGAVGSTLYVSQGGGTWNAVAGV